MRENRINYLLMVYWLQSLLDGYRRDIVLVIELFSRVPNCPQQPPEPFSDPWHMRYLCVLRVQNINQ